VTRIFVDTSALLSLLDADDPRQASVRDAFVSLATDDLVTHGYVVAESIAVARRRLGVDGAIALIDDVLPALELVPIDGELHSAALTSYRESLPSGASFVDHVSLALMARDSIETAFVLDSDFAAAGINVIPSS
jgi:predicted nucleic acid-binding protein